ncbi:alpha/beta hydrolase [Flavobacterium sp. MAH-1]|uniref:Alpha/beta hydrolase n=1 Tax=Flavobacterium agri TaxID=2743471 RepID=A0A7Y8Y0Y8_9FLAO|nr:alpha/beta hydrolase [Flavobacterium agri]NUY80560.1 alpha/beta hydrolase [Flavobacterium agri]NYA70584.1 alpha/beta hydrolase [Flavobacterium agri]
MKTTIITSIALLSTILSFGQIDTALSGNYAVENKTREFLKAVHGDGTGKQLYELSYDDARKVLIGAQTGNYKLQPADITEKTITQDGKTVKLTIVKPKGAKGNLPTVMYFHGGGWVLGNFFTHERLVRELAVGANVAVVFVNYTPSPEALFPVANEEAYAATKWIKANGASLGLNTTKLGVAGDSVGGNMAIAVTLMAKDRKGPHIDFQLLFYPVTDDNLDTASYQQFANGHFLTKNAMDWFWKTYAPKTEDRNSIYASPLRADIDQLKGLPEALVIVAENDVLRDEGEAYAKKLNAAGVKVTATRYIGTIHDFVMLNPITGTPAPRAAIAQAIDFLKAETK